MVEETIKTIKETENEADEIIRKADATCTEILEKAAREAKEIKEQAVANAKKQAEADLTQPYAKGGKGAEANQWVWQECHTLLMP